MTCPVGSQERFDELKRVIHQASVFEGAVYSRRAIPVHVTVAEFVTIDESLEICGSLADRGGGGSFWCDRLEYIVPDATFHVQRRATFFLGNSRSVTPQF